MSTRIRWAETCLLKPENQEGTGFDYIEGYALTSKKLLDGIASEESPVSGAVNELTYTGRWMVLFLDQTYQIEKILFKAERYGGLGSASAWTMQYSIDSNDGLDGTWTNIPNYTNGIIADSTTGLNNLLTFPAPFNARFIRVKASSLRFEVQRLHLFGKSVDATFQLRTSDDTAELTAEYLEFDVPAYSNANYTATKSFRIKNNDSVAHSYNVEIGTLRAAGDSLISTAGYTTISADGGAQQESQVTTGSIAAGASSLITIHTNIPEPVLTGDGWHYMTLKVGQV